MAVPYFEKISRENHLEFQQRKIKYMPLAAKQAGCPELTLRFLKIFRDQSAIANLLSPINNNHPVIHHHLLRAYVKNFIADGMNADNVRLAHLIQKCRDFFVKFIVP